MSTRMLDYRQMKDLQPAQGLWKQYNPAKAPFAFKAEQPAAACAWQKKTRKALAQTIGFQNSKKVPLQPKIIERVDKGDYIREKLLLRVAEHSLMPVYILIPKEAPGLLPVTLAFNGHGYGVKDIVGLWEDGAERATPDGYHKDFAVELCRRGMVVVAPEISCFGERQTDFGYLTSFPGQQAPTTCTHTAMLASWLGGSAMGLQAWEARRLVDYLGTRRDMDAKRLGAMGISGGGMHTFFSTCLDPRIKACVISGYYCTFRDSILAMHHCPCNFIPGLHVFGEMYDLVGLIAPRPLLIEAGRYDGIFPIKAVRRSVARARAVYDVFGVRNHVQSDYFEGRHQINGCKAYDFLVKYLG